MHTCTCAYHGVGNVSFSQNFAYALNRWYLIKKTKARANLKGYRAIKYKQPKNVLVNHWKRARN